MVLITAQTARADYAVCKKWMMKMADDELKFEVDNRTYTPNDVGFVRSFIYDKANIVGDLEGEKLANCSLYDNQIAKDPDIMSKLAAANLTATSQYFFHN
ncbi:hypothetical protein DYY65_07925 [Nitrososphaera sp. AFS]|nr:hypothetical protein [Nitrososphaera sp. AFS]